MALITRDPNVINNIDKGGKHDTPSMTLFRSKADELGRVYIINASKIIASCITEINILSSLS